MSSGGGFGPSNVGSGQQQPLQHEIDTSAWVQAAKMLAGLIHPDEIKPFVEMHPDTTWKYRTEPGKPDLDHVLNTFRMNTTQLETPESDWETNYQELTQYLSKEVRNKLEEQMTLPFTQRDPSYVVLNRVIGFMASYSSWLGQVTAPKPENSAASVKASENQQLPSVALFSSVNQSDEISKHTENFLALVGPNHPHHDPITQMWIAYNKNLAEIRELAKEAAKKEEPVKEDIKKFRKLSNQIHQDLIHLTNATHGNTLQILIPSLQALENVASALSVENASPSLLFSLSTALAGVNMAVMDDVIGGALGLADFGTGADISYLQGLINELAAFAQTEGGGSQ